mmetsp:Transcript_78743/g.132117  ORF Transcript_78743/g.132117 Transcript_78743/m.132117 type:complete len:1335 (-) Transcript_78743:24-4028(-)
MHVYRHVCAQRCVCVCTHTTDWNCVQETSVSVRLDPSTHHRGLFCGLLDVWPGDTSQRHRGAVLEVHVLRQQLHVAHGDGLHDVPVLVHGVQGLGRVGVQLRAGQHLDPVFVGGDVRLVVVEQRALGGLDGLGGDAERHRQRVQGLLARLHGLLRLLRGRGDADHVHAAVDALKALEHEGGVVRELPLLAHDAEQPPGGHLPEDRLHRAPEQRMGPAGDVRIGQAVEGVLLRELVQGIPQALAVPVDAPVVGGVAAEVPHRALVGVVQEDLDRLVVVGALDKLVHVGHRGERWHWLGAPRGDGAQVLQRQRLQLLNAGVRGDGDLDVGCVAKHFPDRLLDVGQGDRVDLRVRRVAELVVAVREGRDDLLLAAQVQVLQDRLVALVQRLPRALEPVLLPLQVVDDDPQHLHGRLQAGDLPGGPAGRGREHEVDREHILVAEDLDHQQVVDAEQLHGLAREPAEPAALLHGPGPERHHPGQVGGLQGAAPGHREADVPALRLRVHGLEVDGDPVPEPPLHDPADPVVHAQRRGLGRHAGGGLRLELHELRLGAARRQVLRGEQALGDLDVVHRHHLLRDGVLDEARDGLRRELERLPVAVDGGAAGDDRGGPDARLRHRVGQVLGQLLADAVHLLQSDGLDGGAGVLQRLLRVHEGVAAGRGLHQPLHHVLALQLVRLGRQHHGLGEDGRLVPGELRGGDAVLAQPPDLQHRPPDGVLPAADVRVQVQAAHRAALPRPVRLVELHGDEQRVVALHDVEADLQRGDGDLAHELPLERRHVDDRLDRPLGEQVEGEALHQLVLEDGGLREDGVGVLRHDAVGLQHVAVLRVDLLRGQVVEGQLLLRGPVMDHRREVRGHVPHGDVRVLAGVLQQLLLVEARLEAPELLVDDLLHLRRVDVAHDVEDGVLGLVVRVVVLLHLRHRPGLDHGDEADGEAAGDAVLAVQRRQDLDLHAVLHGVDHARLGEHHRALLLQPPARDGRAHDVDEGVEGQGQHGLALAAVVQDAGAGGVEDGVVEVRVGVGLGPGAGHGLALGAAHPGHVLEEMGHALLVLQLVGGPGEHLQVGLEFARGGGVGEDDVPHAILEGAVVDIGADGELTWGKRGSLLHRTSNAVARGGRGPSTTATLHRQLQLLLHLPLLHDLLHDLRHVPRDPEGRESTPDQDGGLQVAPEPREEARHLRKRCRPGHQPLWLRVVDVWGHRHQAATGRWVARGHDLGPGRAEDTAWGHLCLRQAGPCGGHGLREQGSWFTACTGVAEDRVASHKSDDQPEGDLPLGNPGVRVLRQVVRDGEGITVNLDGVGRQQASGGLIRRRDEPHVGNPCAGMCLHHPSRRQYN